MLENRIFAGYSTAKNLHEITPAQAQKLTHLNVAFGIVENGVLNVSAIEKYLPHLDRIRSYNPHLQILLSTGGGNQIGHGEATKTDEGLARYVRSVMDIIEQYGFDGIDCDWEFPCYTGIMEEKYQYTKLMIAYRQEINALSAKLGKKCLLTIASAAGAWFLDCVEMEKIHPLLDFINLMTYDLRGWDQPAGHHTNLYEPVGAPIAFSIDEGVRLLLDTGVPAEKIVIGAAFYSRRWDGVSDVNHGMHQSSITGGDYGPDYTAIYHIYEKDSRFVKYWDDTAKACWLFDGYSFISYDDPRSIAYKCAYVKEKKLGGMMYWEHGADKTGLLFNAIYDNLML